jgi:hypothetical protein
MKQEERQFLEAVNRTAAVEGKRLIVWYEPRDLSASL